MKKGLILFFLVFVGISLTACHNDLPDGKTYNIVITNATIPPMMAILDVLENENETYMWYGRKNTFIDIDNFGENMTFIGDPKNQEEVPGIKPEVLSEMKNIVLDLYITSKETANFNLYVVDYGIKVALQIFIEQGIKEENYQVFLLEDGSGSYEQFNQAGYAASDGKTVFDAKVAELDQLIADIKQGGYTWGSAANMINWDLAFAYATKDNVEYWLQYPEIITSLDPAMQAFLDDQGIHFVKKKLTPMFHELSEDKQSIFQNAILDLNTFGPILNIDNGKQTLLVTGTSYDGEDQGFVTDLPTGDGELEIAMDYIIETYGDAYNIFFKPHPSWMPSLGDDMGVRWESVLGQSRPTEWEQILRDRVDYFADNNIVVLPGQTPIEAILWAFPEVKIGGYNSSLYMNASNEQVLFFILSANDFNLLSRPLPTIILNNGLKHPQTNENPLIIHPGLFS